MLMLTIDNALNRIFRVQRRRSVVQNIFIYWGVITLGPLFIGGSISSTYFALREAAGVSPFSFLADALVGVVPFILTCAALMLLYGVVPARRVDWRHAVLGGLLAGIGFEIAKRGFAIYLTRVPTYTLIYGAFATIPIFLIWLYLSWVVVLTGAVFTAVLPVFGRKSERHRVPGEELADALGVLGALARAHEHGDVLPLRSRSPTSIARSSTTRTRSACRRTILVYRCAISFAVSGARKSMKKLFCRPPDKGGGASFAKCGRGVLRLKN